MARKAKDAKPVETPVEPQKRISADKPADPNKRIRAEE
jgi:hypothetical protein